MSDPYLIDGQKVSYHPARIAQWESAQSVDEKLRVYPIYVEISPVGHCNHRCTFCAVDYIGYKARSLDTNLLSQRLWEMSRLGVKSVMFAGEGEPLLHKEIDRLVDSGYKAGLDIAFTTNGVLLEKLTDVMHEVKWIKVSLNAGNKETYAKIHQTKEADWDKVWGNIERAVSRGLGSTSIGVQTIVLPDNIDSIEELIKKTSDSGVNYLVLKPYSQHLSSETNRYKDIKYSEFKEQLQRLEELSNKSSSSHFQVILRKNAISDWDGQAHQYHKCHATPYFWAYVMATGDVYGCSAYLLDDRFNYGNLLSSSFEEVWTGSKRQESIRFVEEELDISACRVNCRMNQVNKFLDGVRNPNPHVNFI